MFDDPRMFLDMEALVDDEEEEEEEEEDDDEGTIRKLKLPYELMVCLNRGIYHR